MKLDLPPGVVNTNSRKRNSANWRETHLVRWEGPTLEPVGGWEKLDYPLFSSVCRAMHKWTSNAGIQYTAYLCEEHCYVDAGGDITEITPIDGIAPPPSSDSGGYGDLLYNDDTYGDERAARSRRVLITPAYTLDNWGEQLRVMTSNDGRLLSWDPATPTTPLVAVTDAPVGNRSFVVTPERHIILFGAGGAPAKFAWCDQEDDTDWNIADVTSKAGEYDVEPRSPIVAHKLIAGGVLMMTARGVAYLIRNIGLPYVYAYEKVGECPTPLSAASIAEYPEGAIWASSAGFWAFNGVSVGPVECPVWDWIRDQMDVFSSKYEANIVNVSSKGELWFSFSTNATPRPDKVIIFNYRDNVWSMGSLSRTCGLSFPNDPNPLMSDGLNVHKHEEGYIYNGEELPWAETFTMNIASGVVMTTIMKMLPEVVAPANVLFNFYKVNNPSSEMETMSAAKYVKSNGYVDVRETARDMRMRVSGVVGGYWSLGPVEVEIVGRGQK